MLEYPEPDETRYATISCIVGDDTLPIILNASPCDALYR